MKEEDNGSKLAELFNTFKKNLSPREENYRRGVWTGLSVRKEVAIKIHIIDQEQVEESLGKKNGNCRDQLCFAARVGEQKMDWETICIAPKSNWY